jgi:hypothetical protein
MSFGIAKEDDRASSNGWRRCKEEEDRLSISPVKTSSRAVRVLWVAADRSLLTDPLGIEPDTGFDPSDNIEVVES